MPNCVAIGCHNNGMIPGITYHSIPKKAEFRRKWVNAIKRKDWEPSKHSRICSAHFREADIDRTSLSCVRIREGAVPTIFPAFSQVKDRPVRKRAQPEVDSTQHVNIQSPTKKLKSKLCKTKNELLKSKKKIKSLQASKRRLKKKVANLESIVDSLRNKMNFAEDDCSLLSSLSQNSQCLIKRSLDKASNPSLNKEYDERLRSFAITLHFLSPKAYVYVRKTFNTALPHPRTLRRWYSSVNAEPGFSIEALRALKEHSSNVSKQPICSLMLDCMAIRQKIEWDGKRFHGTINVGNSAVDDDSAPVATEALVFHVVSINDGWKIPIGYFFVASTKGDQLSGLVKQCLSLLHDANIRVAALTCDGTACNIAMASLLGCSLDHNNLITWFHHPTTNDKINFFLDPPHMLKLVRNTLADKKILHDADKNRIEWRYIRQLHALQVEEGLHLGNKLTNSHVNFVKQKMKVKLAAQLLSTSVADSLQYLKVNNVSGFEHCSATIEFIRTFDKLFDILNSKSIRAKYSKQALYPGNYVVHREFLLKAKLYIWNLSNEMGQPILSSRRKTGFLGFLTCIDSALAMYEQFVKFENPLLNYLPLYKVSQDHLERLFCYVRSRGGHNNNPSCREFTGSFKRILLHKELQESNGGNALILSKAFILTLNKRNNPLQSINCSTPGWRALDEDDKISLNEPELESDENNSVLNMLGNTSMTACNVVEYIAGYVVRKLRGKIICQQCIEMLTCNISPRNSLVSCKNRGGLVQPSEGVVKLCLLAETIVKQYVCQDNVTAIKNLEDKMTVSVMTQCVGVNLFQSSHCLDTEPEDNHELFLIKLVCSRYFKIRLCHFSKLFNDSIHKNKVRSSLTKIVTFMGQ